MKKDKGDGLRREYQRKDLGRGVRGKYLERAERKRPGVETPVQVRDTELDLEDVPELTDAELRRARRVGRPKTGHAKRLIAIRIDTKLLAQIRRIAAKRGKPYQTLIHELLQKAVQRST